MIGIERGLSPIRYGYDIETWQNQVDMYDSDGRYAPKKTSVPVLKKSTSMDRARGWGQKCVWHDVSKVIYFYIPIIHNSIFRCMEVRHFHVPIYRSSIFPYSDISKFVIPFSDMSKLWMRYPMLTIALLYNALHCSAHRYFLIPIYRSSVFPFSDVSKIDISIFR